MNKNDPFAKLGGGALDQELFKSRPSPLPASDHSDKPTKASLQHSTRPSRKASEKKETQSVMSDVMTSSLHDVKLRTWKDTIENTETHNSSLRLTTEEGDNIEDLITDLKRKWKIKSSLNEVARLGLLYILHDFRKHRENSLVYKVKKS